MCHVTTFEKWPVVDGVKVRPTRHKIGDFGDVLPSQSLGVLLKRKVTSNFRSLCWGV